MSSFASRHIGPDDKAIASMLAAIGAASLDDLIDQALPGGLANAAALKLPPAISEAQALRELAEIEIGRAHV